MLKNTYKPGLWNVICDVCARKLKSNEVRQRWDGFMVCEEDWEMRHPLDFIRAYQKEDTLPFTRPEPADQFVTVSYIALTDPGHIAGYDGG